MKKLKFRHIHVCPTCGATRDCPVPVPYLECARPDACAEHREPPRYGAVAVRRGG